MDDHCYFVFSLFAIPRPRPMYDPTTHLHKNMELHQHWRSNCWFLFFKPTRFFSSSAVASVDEPARYNQARDHHQHTTGGKNRKSSSPTWWRAARWLDPDITNMEHGTFQNSTDKQISRRSMPCDFPNANRRKIMACTIFSAKVPFGAA